jgi:hypothetical protein
MKKWFLTLVLYSGKTSIRGYEGVNAEIDLPEGCRGLMLVFDSKEAAYNYCGDNVEISEVIIGGCEDESS